MGMGDFGAIFRGTEKPDPTAARLCAKAPSFQFGTCDRQGSHGQCSRLGVSHGKSLSEKFPSPMPRRNASTPTSNQAKNAPNIIMSGAFLVNRSNQLRERVACTSRFRLLQPKRSVQVQFQPSHGHVRPFRQLDRKRLAHGPSQLMDLELE